LHNFLVESGANEAFGRSFLAKGSETDQYYPRCCNAATKRRLRQRAQLVPYKAQQPTLGGSPPRMEKLAPPMLLGFNLKKSS
jgi:hypothetical protein